VTETERKYTFPGIYVGTKYGARQKKKKRDISPDRGIEAGEHADQSTPSVGV
jgi:hypothetical protein